MVEAILMLICFVIGSLVTLLAYTKGLQHNYNLKHDTEPKISNPIKEYIETKKEQKVEKEKETFMNELLNDPRDEV